MIFVTILEVMSFNKAKRKTTSFAMPMTSPKQGKREIEQVLEQNLALRLA